eukprot:TRINITY_DN785_c1_g1_i15.p1 TRINITY_DN785_c1_g1~~TRINITY_DN785_c1_g1_i15.p1  ORF type:complete len:209 (+),score=-18.46 TRINITY_DN785_c1_g1_i15:1174-1800(+)
MKTRLKMLNLEQMPQLLMNQLIRQHSTCTCCIQAAGTFNSNFDQYYQINFGCSNQISKKMYYYYFIFQKKIHVYLYIYLQGYVFILLDNLIQVFTKTTYPYKHLNQIVCEDNYYCHLCNKNIFVQQNIFTSWLEQNQIFKLTKYYNWLTSFQIKIKCVKIILCYLQNMVTTILFYKLITFFLSILIKLIFFLSQYYFVSQNPLGKNFT